jgi:hypothetical protein
VALRNSSPRHCGQEGVITELEPQLLQPDVISKYRNRAEAAVSERKILDFIM